MIALVDQFVVAGWEEAVASIVLGLMTAAAATGTMEGGLAWAAHAGVTALALLLADRMRLFKAGA